MKKTKEAVSLIVLVLTIVIMIILGGVIILNLSNSGIIDKASTTVDETNLQEMNELASIGWAISYGKGARTAEALKAGVMAYLASGGIEQDEIDEYTFSVTATGVTVTAKSAIDPLNPSGTIPEGAVYYRYDKGFVYCEELYDDYEAPGGLYLDETGGTEYTSGQLFPEEPQLGDTYIYNGYKYVYNAYFAWDICRTDSLEWNHNVKINGWGVVYIGTDKNPGEILESINGKPIKSLAGAFCYRNIAIATVPKIPSTVTDLSAAFSGCEIEAAPEIPYGVEWMDCTFSNCESLKVAPIIPATVTGMWATFSDCYNLMGTITINATPEYYDECFNYTGITDVSQILGDCKNKQDLIDASYY